MKVVDLVKNKIDRFAEGYVFTYGDFDIDVKNTSALKVALYRLVQSGKIQRLSKGRFYKPRKGIIGNLKPDEYEVVKDLLKGNGNPAGYITGYSIFNRLKLTTQVPNIVQIGTNLDKRELRRGIYRIRFVRQWNRITKENVFLLQLLDCIRFIKRIPGAELDDSFNRIKDLVKSLDKEEIRVLVRLAMNYPPYTRALTGAMLEEMDYAELSEKLLKSLKATTWHQSGLSDAVITNKYKWRIK